MGHYRLEWCSYSVDLFVFVLPACVILCNVFDIPSINKVL